MEQIRRPEDLTAVVLCGGESRRMGRAKADLPFGESTLLSRVTERLFEVVDQVILVTAPEQTVVLPLGEVRIVRDAEPHWGPLAGISAGLAAAQHVASLAFVTGCDVPFLEPAFIHLLADLRGDHDIVVPFDDEHWYPLAAIYRTSLAPIARQLLESGVRRPRELFDHVDTKKVSVADIGSGARPQSLVNVNTPRAYRDALVAAGCPVPQWAWEEDA